MNEEHQNADGIKIGLELKDARQKAGMSIKDVADKTRIQKMYLSDIEKGDYSELPGDFYARAFIQQFADAIGLDGQKMAKEFDKELDAEKQVEAEESSENAVQEDKKDKQPKNKAPKKHAKAKKEPKASTEPNFQPASTRTGLSQDNSQSSWLKKFFPIVGTLVIVLIVLAIVVVAGVKISHNSSDTASNSSAISVSQDNAKLASSTRTKKPVKAKKAAQKAVKITSTSPTAYTVKGAKKGTKFTVKGVSARTWSSITVNGTQVFQGILSKNQKKSVKVPAKATVNFNSGSATGLLVSINGTKVPNKAKDANQVGNLTFKFI